jgi:hypothetical protein
MRRYRDIRETWERFKSTPTGKAFVNFQQIHEQLTTYRTDMSYTTNVTTDQRETELRRNCETAKEALALEVILLLDEIEKLKVEKNALQEKS